MASRDVTAYSVVKKQPLPKHIKELIFQLLKTGFQLGMDATQEVLGVCGYNAKEVEAEEVEEELVLDSEDESKKRKSTQGVNKIQNPNLADLKDVKARDVNLGKTTELSRRERKELEKGHEQYMKLQAQGKTEQPRKDLGPAIAQGHREFELPDSRENLTPKRLDQLLCDAKSEIRRLTNICVVKYEEYTTLFTIKNEICEALKRLHIQSLKDNISQLEARKKSAKGSCKADLKKQIAVAKSELSHLDPDMGLCTLFLLLVQRQGMSLS